MYSSQSPEPMTVTGLEEFLADARTGNQARNVTGAWSMWTARSFRSSKARREVVRELMANIAIIDQASLRQGVLRGGRGRRAGFRILEHGLPEPDRRAEVDLGRVPGHLHRRAAAGQRRSIPPAGAQTVVTALEAFILRMTGVDAISAGCRCCSSRSCSSRTGAAFAAIAPRTACLK